MTDTVRHLPAYPDQVQRVNTPRTARLNVTLVEQKDAEMEKAESLRAWWNNGGREATTAVASQAAESVVAREVAAARESLLTVLQAYREEIRAELAQEVGLARAQAIDMGNRIATEVHGRLDRQAEDMLQMDARFVNFLNEEGVELTKLLNKEGSTPPTGQAEVTPVTLRPITLVEWIFIIISFGIYRPTRNQQ